MLTREQAQQLTQKILKVSQFPDCTVEVSEREESFIRFANNGVTTSGFTTEATVTVSSTRGSKTGVASISELDDASIERGVRLSEKLAEISPENPERLEPLGPQQYSTEDNWDEATARARSPQLVPHVKAIIDSAVAKKLVSAGFLTRTAGLDVTANKKGNFLYERATDSRLTTTVRTPSGSSSGWAGQPSVRISELNGADVGSRAIEKCLRWDRKLVKPEPGRYTVVLESTAVCDLVSRLQQSFSARAAEEGRSFLSKRGGGTLVGDKLFPESITLRSDPFDKRYPTQLSTSGGLPARPITWIEKGVVENLAYDRYWASKTGKEPTPSAQALILEGGDATLEELIKSTERGLLVTRFWYIRPVNPQTVQLTGLTRDGLFLIEKGEITQPVMNLRFNDSPVSMLQNVIRLGRAQRSAGGEGVSLIAPPLVAKDFSFTSISEAV